MANADPIQEAARLAAEEAYAIAEYEIWPGALAQMKENRPRHDHGEPGCEACVLEAVEAAGEKMAKSLADFHLSLVAALVEEARAVLDECRRGGNVGTLATDKLARVLRDYPAPRPGA